MLLTPELHLPEISNWGRMFNLCFLYKDGVVVFFQQNSGSSCPLLKKIMNKINFIAVQLTDFLINFDDSFALLALFIAIFKRTNTVFQAVCKITQIWYLVIVNYNFVQSYILKWVWINPKW